MINLFQCMFKRSKSGEVNVIGGKTARVMTVDPKYEAQTLYRFNCAFVGHGLHGILFNSKKSDVRTLTSPKIMQQHKCKLKCNRFSSSACSRQ